MSEQEFLQLVTILASCDTTNDPGINDYRRWTQSLQSIYRSQRTVGLAFLSSINRTGLPNEAPEALLLRAHRMATELLPTLTEQYRMDVRVANSETEHEKFLREQSLSDPFIDGTLFTRDSYAGQGDIEPEQTESVDAFGYIQQ